MNLLWAFLFKKEDRQEKCEPSANFQSRISVCVILVTVLDKMVKPLLLLPIIKEDKIDTRKFPEDHLVQSTLSSVSANPANLISKIFGGLERWLSG